MSKSFPDFLVIGAGKSGTTSLYYHLKQHPQVFVPEVKETNFFALLGEDLKSPKDDPEEMKYYPWSVTTWEQYHQLYADAGPSQVRGDVSPMYLYHPAAIENIKKYAPKAKMIAILRQPAERLYSRFQHLARDNRKPTEHFEDALTEGNIWWKRNDLVQEGFFYRHLSKFYDNFPKDQILVFLYDDLKNNPAEVIKKVYGFLEVDDSFQPDLTVQYNKSGEIKNKMLDKVIGRKSVIFKSLKKAFPSGYNSIKKNPFLKKTVNTFRNKNLTPVPLSKDSKSRITEIYRDDILKLQDLLGRDLTKWLT